MTLIEAVGIILTLGGGTNSIFGFLEWIKKESGSDNTIKQIGRLIAFILSIVSLLFLIFGLLSSFYPKEEIYQSTVGLYIIGGVILCLTFLRWLIK